MRPGLTPPIDTVLFDLDGTLRYSEPSAEDLQIQFLQQAGWAIPLEQQHQGVRWVHYYWAQSPELIADVSEFGNELPAEFWRQYAYRYLISLQLPEEAARNLAGPLRAWLEVRYLQNRANKAFPDAAATLQALKDRGFTVGLVSNRSQPCHEECRQLGLLDYFDFAYVAGEVDAWKPDPLIFKRAFKLANTTPANTVYIGDNLYADINGARNAGIQPVLIDPEGVFPQADCPVIGSLTELLDLLV